VKYINEAMHLKKKNLIWVMRKGIIKEELIAFNGVTLNMARHVKSLLRIFLADSGFTLHTSYKGIFSWKRLFTIIMGSSCLSPS
jgi:hypothetical protein